MTAVSRRLKQVLQIQRIQTWPATALLFAAAYLGAGGDLLTPRGVSLLILTLFIHGSSFAHNVVEDYWMDKEDAAKDDHPLTSGDIDYNTAVRAFNVYLFGAELATLAVTVAFAPVKWKALVAVFVMMGAGHWYNDASYSSRSHIAFVPITVTWTTFAAWGWFMATPTLTPLFYLILGYVALRIWFQISVSGRLKEFGHPEEVNELRVLGASLTTPGGIPLVKNEDGWFEKPDGSELAPVNEHDLYLAPGNAKYYAYALSVAETVIGFAIIVVVNPPLIGKAITGVLMLLGVFYTHLLIRRQRWDRDKQMDRMGLIEIIYIYALVLTLAPRIGPFPTGVLLLAGLLWYFGMNAWLWDNASAPGV